MGLQASARNWKWLENPIHQRHGSTLRVALVIRFFDGTDTKYRRVLWLVILINAAMFVIEMGAGQLSGSLALQADALDFLGDATTYGLSLAVIGMSLRVRATAALIKGTSLLLMGLWVIGSTVYQLFILGVPKAEIMGAVGVTCIGCKRFKRCAFSTIQRRRRECAIRMALLKK